MPRPYWLGYQPKSKPTPAGPNAPWAPYQTPGIKIAQAAVATARAQNNARRRQSFQSVIFIDNNFTEGGNNMFENTEPADRELDQEIDRMVDLATKYGLNPDDDDTAQALCIELAAQLDDANRTESTRDVVQATVERVAAKHQAQTHLDAIKAVHGREPTIGENLRAGYAQAKPVEQPVQPPPEGSSPLKMLDYYYKHLAKK